MHSRNGYYEEAIMKQRRPVRVLVGAAIVSAGLAVMTQTAFAANPPRLAKAYTTWLTRAMNVCTSPTLSVVGANEPSGACAQQSSDVSIKFNFGQLTVNKRGKILLYMAGATAGDQVDVQLTVRSTRSANTTQFGVKKVTFPDQQFTCGPVAAHPNGLIIGSLNLAACSPVADSGLTAPGTNVEIIGAQVVNHTGSTVVGIGGIVP